MSLLTGMASAMMGYLVCMRFNGLQTAALGGFLLAAAIGLGIGTLETVLWVVATVYL